MDNDQPTAARLSRGKLGRLMAKIGLIGFGGGNALIPVMQKELVDEEKAVTAEEFDEDVVVASITPGALPVEIAGGVGSRLYGAWGMLIGSVGMALPGVLLVLLFLSTLSGLDKAMTRQISFLTLGVSAYIICLLMDYIVTTLRRLPTTAAMIQAWLVIGMVFFLTCGKTLYRFLSVTSPPLFAIATVHVFAVAFFLIFFLHGRLNPWRMSLAAVLSIVYVLAVGKGAFLSVPAWFYVTGGIMFVLSAQGLAGSISRGLSWRQVELTDTKKELVLLMASVIIACLVGLIVSSDTIAYGARGLLSSVMSFGGGDAYLTVADGLFVETALITEDEFYGLVVPIVNLLPGSILCKTLSAIGYFIGYDASGAVLGGLTVAVVGFTMSIAASCGVFSLVRCLYREFQRLEIFQVVRLVIRPIVSGLLLTVALALIYQMRKLGLSEGTAWLPVGLIILLSALNSYLYFFRNLSNLKILCFSVGVAMVVCNSW